MTPPPPGVKPVFVACLCFEQPMYFYIIYVSHTIQHLFALFGIVEPLAGNYYVHKFYLKAM